MKAQLVSVILALVAAVVIADPTTTIKPLDGHNLESISGILTDKTKLSGYISCVLNKGPCDASSQRLKAITQNALGEDCNKCDAKQKQLLAKMAAFVATNLPTEWEQMKDMFDPNKAHRKAIDELVAAGKAMAASTPVPSAAVTTPKA